MTTSEQDTSSSARSRYPHWESVLFWCLLLGGCAVFLLMNFYTPIKEDDIFHSYIGGGTGRPKGAADALILIPSFFPNLPPHFCRKQGPPQR